MTAKVREVAAADHDIAYWLGSAYALLGDEKEALHWLDAASKLGNENYLWFASDPNWALLKDNPQYQRLMVQIESEFNSRVRV